ncbi:MAG: hypothetical protein EOP92_23590, partial [Lysobacteraceae bacterium]
MLGRLAVAPFPSQRAGQEGMVVAITRRMRQAAHQGVDAGTAALDLQARQQHRQCRLARIQRERGLQAALRVNPRHEASRQTLVSLLIEAKRPDEAMAQLQAALALDARQPALAMLLARLQIERGGPGID